MSDVYHQPQVTYTVKINGKTPGDDPRVSFKTNYNQVAITRNCSDQSTNTFQVWVTLASEENWGLGIGVQACNDVSAVAKATDKSSSFTATNSIFTQGDGLYRLALCTRGDLDLTWDVTEILIVVSGLIWKPADADAAEMVVSNYNPYA